MKRKKLLPITCGIVLAIFVAYLLGLTYRFNFLSACVDIVAKNYQIVKFGEPSPIENQEYIIAPKLGFQISRVLGCEIPTVAEQASIAYNKIMGNYIEKKICKNWRTILTKQAEELAALDSMALSLVKSDSLKMKRKDIPKGMHLVFLIDKRDSLIYKLSGYGQDSLQKTYKYFEVTADLKKKSLITVKNVKTQIQ